jgi:hypothetical protein
MSLLILCHTYVERICNVCRGHLYIPQLCAPTSEQPLITDNCRQKRTWDAACAERVPNTEDSSLDGKTSPHSPEGHSPVWHGCVIKRKDMTAHRNCSLMYCEGCLSMKVFPSRQCVKFL